MAKRTIFEGDIFKTHTCGDCIVVDYKNSKEIFVRFLETGYIGKTCSGDLKRGYVKDRSVPEKSRRKSSVKNGQVYSSKQYGDFIVINYIDSFTVVVEFLDSKERVTVTAGNVRCGSVKDPSKELIKEGNSFLKIGDVFTTNNSGDCKVVRYHNFHEVVVEFIETGHEMTVQTQQLLKGCVRDPLAKNNINGFLGIARNGEKANRKIYAIWRQMLNRCYNKDAPNYHRYGGRGVTVCDEWHNYQNYAEWYEENYIENFEVDKDIGSVNDLTYSPDTCNFIPQKLNNLISSVSSVRGTHILGAISYKYGYISCIRHDGLDNYLGVFKTEQEAFLAYKEKKEYLIKEYAKELFNEQQINEDVYNRLLKWEVIPEPT